MVFWARSGSLPSVSGNSASGDVDFERFGHILGFSTRVGLICSDGQRDRHATMAVHFRLAKIRRSVPG